MHVQLELVHRALARGLLLDENGHFWRTAMEQDQMAFQDTRAPSIPAKVSMCLRILAGTIIAMDTSPLTPDVHYNMEKVYPTKISA